MEPALSAYLKAFPRCRCPRCGYSLDGITVPTCPECGEGLTLHAVRAARLSEHYGRISWPQIVGLGSLGVGLPLVPLAAAAVVPSEWRAIAGTTAFVAGLIAVVASLVWRSWLSKRSASARWAYALACLTPLVLAARVLFWR